MRLHVKETADFIKLFTCSKNSKKFAPYKPMGSRGFLHLLLPLIVFHYKLFFVPPAKIINSLRICLGLPCNEKLRAVLGERHKALSSALYHSDLIPTPQGSRKPELINKPDPLARFRIRIVCWKGALKAI